MRVINKLNRGQNTDADIKYDPGHALSSILSLGVAIGQMDAAGDPNTAATYQMALEAIDRIAGFYEHHIG